MFNHMRCLLWALRALWGIQAITPKNRFFLWRKSTRLYLSFLAFTDNDRPAIQLRRAMIAAVLSAIYDYDTDWVKVENPLKSLFLKNLDQLLADHPNQLVAARVARELFLADWHDQLSTDGLERGSAALKFYSVVIGSRWMSCLSAAEIDDLGRKLQMVDDLLDLEIDQKLGERNCFLTHPKEFSVEIIEFFNSDFFRSLERNSSVYRLLRKRCESKLAGRRLIAGSALIDASALKTAGAYAAVTTVIGFRFYADVPLLFVTLATASFVGITMSIMSFNAWVDREHDRKKGKTFASENPKLLLNYWIILSAATATILAGTAALDWRTAVFCAAIWILGLFYSYVPHWYVIQNLIVALCSASPMLVGSVHNYKVAHQPVLIFLALFFIILMREIYKDMEDQEFDPGYKATIPVVKGQVIATLRSIGLTFVWPTFLLLYPGVWVQTVCLMAVPIQFVNAGLLLDHKKSTRVKRMTNWTIAALLVITFVSQ